MVHYLPRNENTPSAIECLVSCGHEPPAVVAVPADLMTIPGRVRKGQSGHLQSFVQNCDSFFYSHQEVRSKFLDLSENHKSDLLIFLFIDQRVRRILSSYAKNKISCDLKHCAT